MHSILRLINRDKQFLTLQQMGRPRFVAKLRGCTLTHPQPAILGGPIGISAPQNNYLNNFLTCKITEVDPLREGRMKI